MAADLSHATFLYRAGQDRDFPIPDGPIVRIGFDRSNGISIPFEGVSRSHARLSFDGKTYWIEDAGSSNGTFLNGRRVTKKQRIGHLDVVTLGRRTDLIFVRKQVIAVPVKQRGIRAAWLEALDGPEAGSRREIPRGSITLGRAPSSNVVIESNLVSKSHARLERSGLQLSLTDLQSANGTFVNGERVDSRVLADGEEINLGGSRTYRVHIEEGDVEVRESSAPVVTSALATKLPTDWKTRIEWTPEEKAAFDEVRRGPASRGKTVPRPAVAVVPREAPAKPAPPPVRAASAPPAPKEIARQEPGPAPAPPAVGRPGPETRDVHPPSPPAAYPAAPPARPPSPPPVSAASPAASRPEPAKKPPAPPAAPPSAPSARPAPAAQAAASTRVTLEGKNQRFAVGPGDHDVGRLPACGIYIAGPQISRRHAVLHVTAGAVVIEDLGSANGTFVNGKKITGQRPLSNDDHLQFGDTGFRVRIGS